MSTWLITGCSRGQGLETVKQLCASNTASVVIAGARNEPSPALRKLADEHKKLHIVKMDVNRMDEVRAAAAAAEKLLPDGLDVLVNNAGIFEFDAKLEEASGESFEAILNTNVVGVQRVTMAFLPLLRKGREKKIVNITSMLGNSKMSMGMDMNCSAYKVSNVAQNGLTMLYAHALAPEGFTVIPLSPGWVQTDLGGPDAILPVSVSVEQVLKFIVAAKQDANGVLTGSDGKTLEP